MSKKTEILKGYDDYIEGKRSSKFAMFLVAGVCLLVTVIALILNFLTNIESLGQVQVIDSSGRAVPAEVKRRDEVLLATAQQHVANAMFNLNSFDRATINENQAKAYFLVEKKSADRIFSSFNTTGAYNDAIRNGFIYKAEFTKLTKFDGDKEPYAFEAEGILTVTDGSREIKNKIVGKGLLRYITPSYPTNPQGFIIVDYLQTYEPLNQEE